MTSEVKVFMSAHRSGVTLTLADVSRMKNTSKGVGSLQPSVGDRKGF